MKQTHGVQLLSLSYRKCSSFRPRPGLWDTYPQQQWRGEVRTVCFLGLNEGTFDNSFLSVHRIHEGEDKPGSSIRHG